MAGSSARGGASAILRRALPPLLLGAVLLLPSPSWSHARASALTGTIKVIAGGIEVTVTNNGPDATNYFWIRMVQKVRHKGASIDRGGGCGPGPDEHTVKCGVSYAGFEPGQTYVVTIMTDAPYPPNGGAELFTGPGTNGPLIPAGSATGPEAPPAVPCKCALLTARIVPSSVKLSFPGSPSLRLRFTVHWVLNCSQGDGGCAGSLKLLAPQQKPNPKTGDKGYTTHWTIGVSATGRIGCKGACAEVSEGGRDVLLSGKRLGPNERAHESIPIVVERTCQGKKLAPIRLSIAFNGDGAPDLSKSKLR